MRALFAGALAIGLPLAPGAPLAAQATHGSHATSHARRSPASASTAADESARASAATRLRTWLSGAILLATRLERKQAHTPEHMRSDVNALGRNIADAQRALTDFQRGATGAEKQRLDSVRTRLGEARTRFRELASAEPDSDEVAGHSAAVHRLLAAADAALRGRPAGARPTGPARRGTRRSSTPKGHR